MNDCAGYLQVFRTPLGRDLRLLCPREWTYIGAGDGAKVCGKEGKYNTSAHMLSALSPNGRK